MPIELPRGLPFSVDTWTPSSKMKRHHFLTHAHGDHCDGLSAHFSYPIYASNFTRTIVLQLYPQLDDSLFVGIEVGQSLVINDPDGPFSVMALDANHCPGALMFLFEGNFGNVLHTGDCRLVSACLQRLPFKYIENKGKQPKCQLDYIFLDCTFGKFPWKIPDRDSAIQQVINCIWKHPDVPIVYLACDVLGQEEILMQVCKTFGSKIYVDKTIRSECVHALGLTFPEIVSDDPYCRFHLFEGFPKLYERAKSKLMEAEANRWPKPLIIRPSVQWYACIKGSEVKRKPRFSKAVRDEFGVWHVCYSTHSSRDELELALQLLSPKWVVSTTPDCLAIELDYVKEHCLIRKKAHDNALMKLLDIHIKESHSSELQLREVDKMPVSCYQSETRAITLFGRARHGHAAPISAGEVCKKKGTVHGPATTSQKLEWPERESKMVEISQDEDGNEEIVSQGSKSSINPVDFTESFRKAYRSINVHVPRPLPSLVELMSSKRSWRVYDF